MAYFAAWQVLSFRDLPNTRTCKWYGNEGVAATIHKEQEAVEIEEASRNCRDFAAEQTS